MKSPLHSHFRVAAVMAAAAILTVDSRAQDARAAEAEAEAQAEGDAADVADGIVILERRIEARRQRIAELSRELIDLDARIEKRVDQVIELFKSVDDSKQTGTRVARLRGEVLDGLRKNAELYAQKRRALRAELDDARQGIPEELVKHDLEAFDARIMRRLSQAVEVGQSFAPAEEHPEYIVVQKDRRWRGDDESIRKNEDFEQDRKVQSRVRTEERELLDGIEKAVEYLTGRNRQIAADLERNDIPNERKEILRADLERNETLLAKLRESRGDIDESPGKAGREVDRAEADDIASFLHDLRDDLRADQVKLFALYSELNRQRAGLGALTKALEEAKGESP